MTVFDSVCIYVYLYVDDTCIRVFTQHFVSGALDWNFCLANCQANSAFPTCNEQDEAKISRSSAISNLVTSNKKDVKRET